MSENRCLRVLEASNSVNDSGSTGVIGSGQLQKHLYCMLNILKNK